MILNKKHLIILVLIITLSGVFGFYGGRYYEQRNARNRFLQRSSTGERLYRSGSSSPTGIMQRDRDMNRPNFDIRVRE
jgi:hypothetical protein